jgi:hypothetical protein
MLTTVIQPPGISGEVVPANSTSQLSLNDNDVALISCDASAYPGNINVDSVFTSASNANVSAVVFYSQQADACNMTGYTGSYPWVYTMKNRNDTRLLMDNYNRLFQENEGHVYLSIGPPNMADQVNNGTASSGSDQSSGQSSSDSSSSNNNPNNPNSNPLGPSPSTAVAMIILYSITGIITALFLVIIITGAVRAHRHPERYGPRNIVGRPRQSRARGLARAMLDTIPIVKFGEREQPKPTDVEMGDNAAQGSENQATEIQEHRAQEGAEPAAPDVCANAASSTEHQDTAERTESATDGGIAAATPVVGTQESEAKQEADTQGCSICTEDFEIGQDQRVLPCNHRFHPACIDPWLLNVSGTCPLCRIDLHPQAARSYGETETDENGNQVSRDGETSTTDEGGDMAPPLSAVEGDPHRRSVRRSIVQGIAGIGRPDRMTREERVLALREYRGRIAARRMTDRSEQDAAAAPEIAAVPPGEESRLRTRLRNVFRIRTMRTGQEDVSATPQEEPAEQAGAENREESREGGLSRPGDETPEESRRT